jgi:hypothetical protein
MSQRSSLKASSNIGKKIAKIPSRKKIDDKWRNEVAPTMPLIRRTIRRMTQNQKEMKNFDLASGPTGVTTTGNLVQLTYPAQGITDITRIGDTIQPVSFEFQGQLNAGDATNVTRLILFRWKPLFGTNTPTISNAVTGILQSVTVAPFASYQNDVVVDGKQAVILWDKYFDQSNATGTAVRSFKVKIKKNLASMQFASGSTTNSTNQICLLAISDSGVTPNPQLTYYSRLLFTDA